MKHRRDIFDEMFDHPELTLRQAYWKVNEPRLLVRWLLEFLLIFLIVAAVIWVGK